MLGAKYKSQNVGVLKSLIRTICGEEQVCFIADYPSLSLPSIPHPIFPVPPFPSIGEVPSRVFVLPHTLICFSCSAKRMDCYEWNYILPTALDDLPSTSSFFSSLLNFFSFLLLSIPFLYFLILLLHFMRREVRLSVYLSVDSVHVLCRLLPVG